MTRRPPTILSAASTSEGGIEVRWEVDTFYADSAEPERVLIDLNGASFQELEGDADSVEIPPETFTQFGAQVVISVSFWWSGSPAEEQQSSVIVPLHQGGGGAGNTGVLPAAKPIVTVVDVRARTANTPSHIKIAWQSNNYNDGNIFWGPRDRPAESHNIRPAGERYSGEFVTDKRLVSATQYVFKVEVRNTLHSPTWISTSIVVRSAADTLSIRAFLMASGMPVTTSLGSVVGLARSVRELLVG
jgi:hypothetical protein